MLRPIEKSFKDFWIKTLGADTLPDDDQWKRWVGPHGIGALTAAIERAADRRKIWTTPEPFPALKLWKIVSSEAKKIATETGYVRTYKTSSEGDDAQVTFTAPDAWMTDEQPTGEQNQ